MFFNRSNISKDFECEATAALCQLDFIPFPFGSNHFHTLICATVTAQHHQAIFRRPLCCCNGRRWFLDTTFCAVLISFLLPQHSNLAFSLRLYPSEIWVFYLAVISWFVSHVEQKKIGSKESEAPGGVERVVRCKNEMQMKQSCDNIDEVQLHNGMVCAGFGNEISNLRDKWTLTCTVEWPTFYYSFHIFFSRTVCWIPFHSTATHKTCQRLKVWIGWPKRDSEMGRNDNTILCVCCIVHTCMYNCKYEWSTTQCDEQMQSV